MEFHRNELNPLEQNLISRLSQGSMKGRLQQIALLTGN